MMTDIYMYICMNIYMNSATVHMYLYVYILYDVCNLMFHLNILQSCLWNSSISYCIPYEMAMTKLKLQIIFYMNIYDFCNIMIHQNIIQSGLWNNSISHCIPSGAPCDFVTEYFPVMAELWGFLWFCHRILPCHGWVMGFLVILSQNTSLSWLSYGVSCDFVTEYFPVMGELWGFWFLVIMSQNSSLSWVSYGVSCDYVHRIIPCHGRVMGCPVIMSQNWPWACNVLPGRMGNMECDSE